MNSFSALAEKIRQRLIKDLLRIKEGLSTEARETKEMMETYIRYSQGDASKEEMDEANKQFRSFLKTLGLGAFAILPFSPITIPALIKLGKKFGVDIVPKSFKDH